MRKLLLLAVIGAGSPLLANATLVGDTIAGELNFSITGTTNFFDPANGQVPLPNSGIQPHALVMDPDPDWVEFRYSDGSAGRVNLDVDVDATTITIRQYLIDAANPATNILGWQIWLTDLDFGGPGGVLPGASIVSSDFTGLGLVATDHALHMSYGGGQDITTAAPELVAVIEIVPEPGTALLMGLGLAGLARSRGRRKA